jgi:hypothetical protein
VIELARDLESDVRRRWLTDALKRAEGDPDLLRRLDDPQLAWRAFACGLLADALGEEEEPEG